jgi:SAM-dependent MidA family methyltransferase
VPSKSYQNLGNPDLIQKIVSEISQQRRISFARFMELALYDVPYGYYMTQAVDADFSFSDRIGWRGDFFTAPELSPILAKTLVRQVVEIDVQLGHPNPLMFLEIGGGNGSFAVDFLQECQTTASDVFNRLTYQLVERSPSLQSRQASRLKDALGNWAERHVTWKSSLDEIAEDSVSGVIFSNELIDALPVHRVRWENDQLSEIFVTYEGGKFVENLGQGSSPELIDYSKRYKVTMHEGHTSELHLAAEVWMDQVARILHRGVVLTIDYGHVSRDYYQRNRKEGTLLCYYRHQISTNPYIRVGEQDITAHVNFSVLAQRGTAKGVRLVGLTTLAHWLIGLEVEELVRDQDPEAEDVKALAQLLRQDGMGKTFKVLVQQKGLEPFPVQGLRYRAFFEDVIVDAGDI